jgi:hypothetical protein
MDCLFTDKEVKELLIYAEELRSRDLQPLMYVSNDWDFVNSSWTAAFSTIPSSPIYHNDGCIGSYYGMPVYAFDGLDSHTCCVLPNFNDIKPF